MPQFFRNHNQVNVDDMVNRLRANDPDLYDVNCSQWALDAEASKAIFNALKNNTHVKTLRFLGNQSSGSIQYLAASIETHSSLRSIYLGTNSLTDNDLLHLTDALRKNRSSIEVLDINHNHITNQSVPGLVELIKKTTRIEKMDISFNQIDDDGLNAILETLVSNPETSLLELCESDVLQYGFLTENHELIAGFKRFFNARQNSIHSYF